uniref:Uncharacterized protein n=1 Tax=Megaviridae environmental sample TaxID=1737588 RepID=A0A5J6VJ89_9VIRU|nr:MAG: hypothetical protein [Megaviridae environmental sample]
MSFTRQHYDPCETKKQAQESTDPLKYTFYAGKYYNKGKGVPAKEATFKKCTMGTPQLTAANVIDIENELRNLGRPLSQCPSNKYAPTCENPDECAGAFMDNMNLKFSPHMLCDPVPTNQVMPTSPGYDLSEIQNLACDKNI